MRDQVQYLHKFKQTEMDKPPTILRWLRFLHSRSCIAYLLEHSGWRGSCMRIIDQLIGKILIIYQKEYLSEQISNHKSNQFTKISLQLKVSHQYHTKNQKGHAKMHMRCRKLKQKLVKFWLPGQGIQLQRQDMIGAKTYKGSKRKKVIHEVKQSLLIIQFHTVHPNLLQELLEDKVRFNDLDEELKYELDSFVEDMYDSDVLLFKLQSNDDQNQSLPFDYGLFFGYPWNNHPQILTIGRLYLSTICLLNNKISKNHAYISYQTIPNNPNKKAFFIFDGDQQTPSTNATFLRMTRPMEIIQKTIILFENTTIMIDPTQLNRQQQTSRLRKPFNLIKLQ